MIQVIERVGNIIDVVAAESSGVPLKVIEEVTGINKGTLCNLLKSLCEIGYVKKTNNGIYSVGDKLRKLAYPQFVNDTLFTIASNITLKLAEDTREAGMVVVRHDDELQVVAREIYDQNIVINSKVFESLPGYATAIGHIFLAFDTELDVESIYKHELKEMYPDIKIFNGVIEQVQKDGFFTLELKSRHTFALAVPIMRGKKMAAALGLLVPDIRYNAGRGKNFLDILKNYGEKMSRLLS